MSPPQLQANVPCNVNKDATFGPGVQCSQFDFTLTFEQSILVIGISSLYLILFIIRLGQLYRTSVKTLANTILWAKLVCVVETKLNINLKATRESLSQYQLSTLRLLSYGLNNLSLR
jgi:hypothetical protein